MKTRDLLILIGILALAVGIAVLSQRHGNASSQSGNEVLMFPELAVNDIARVKFQTDLGTITFERKSEAWTSPNTYDYPSDFEKVRTFLLAIHDLKKGQVVTADDEQKAQLKLVPPVSSATNVPTMSGTLITMERADGTKLASLLLGKTRNRKLGQQMPGLSEFPDGRYVLVDGTVYLVSHTFSTIPEDRVDWLATKLVDLYTTDIAALSVEGHRRDSIELKRGEDGANLRFDKIGWRKEMDSAKVNDLAGALSYLTVADIADPALGDAELGMEKPVVTWQATTSKGMVYTVLIGAALAEEPAASGEGPDRYMRLSVTCEQSEDTTPDGEKTDAEDDETQQDVTPEEDDDPLEMARELNNRFSKWTYILDGQAAGRFLIEKDELTRKKEKE